MRLHSVGIVAHDIDAMVDFLAGLGFVLSSDTYLEGNWIDSIYGIKGAKMNIIQLASPLGDSQIEVLKYENPAEIGPTIDPRKPYAGQLRMIGVLFENLDEGIEIALGLGATYIGEGTETVGDYRICYVMGPENVIFMLAEERPWWELEDQRIREDATTEQANN